MCGTGSVIEGEEYQKGAVGLNTPLAAVLDADGIEFMILAEKGKTGGYN